MVTVMVAVVMVMAVVVTSNIYVNNSYNVLTTVISALCIQSSHQFYETGTIIIAVL